MSWEPIEPFYSKLSGVTKPTVEFCVGIKDGRQATKSFRAFLTIRTLLMDTPPPFLVAGAVCAIREGTGEHAGKLRLVPGATHPIQHPGGDKKTRIGVVIVPFRLPKGVISVIRRGPAEYDHSNTWLEIDIPEWAFKAEAQPTPKAAGFSMIGGSVPAAGRRA